MNKIKEIGVLTFHSAHNYGSVLQSFALQTVISNYMKENNIDFTYNIINLRIKEQRNFYKIIKKNKNFGSFIGNIFNILHYIDLKKKYDKFEKFISDRLNITDKEYTTIDEVEEDIAKYNYLLCGSDQIWNTRAFDFNWLYYFPFETSAKKISYAASFGSNLTIKDKEIRKKIIKWLSDFNCISVREKKAADSVEKMIKRRPEVLIDPTLMIEKKSGINL